MQGHWERNTAKYATGEIYKIGKIRVGSVFMPSRPRDEPAFYRAHCELPGISISSTTTDFANIEDAKARLERAVNVWFKWLHE